VVCNSAHTSPSYAANNSNGPSLRLFASLNQTTIVENESMCTGKEPEFRTQKPWERRKSVSSSSRSILFYRFWRSLSNRCLYPFTKVTILQNSGVASHSFTYSNVYKKASRYAASRCADLADMRVLNLVQKLSSIIFGIHSPIAAFTRSLK
jgi:hypothetical protein